ncbi:hypothetical protein [Escherichia coli]|uniref:hypothetical protein n=1 Tax=Escherichia coli TaxID=562 RepID=UPI00203E5618|nr:hypothetical protein [Escherichia coli]
MNTEKQLPSGIESEVKYTLQFWLLSNGKVMTEKDGLCNPFPPNCIESAHPFTPFQQNQWIELDTVGKRLARTVLIFTERSDQLSRATDRVPGLPASPGYAQ